MRNLTLNEQGLVAGGLLPPGGGDGGGGGGSGGGGGGEGGVTQEEVVHAASSLGEIIETGMWENSAIGAAIRADEYGTVASGLLQATVNEGCYDYNFYVQTEGDHAPPGYTANIVDWGTVDWSQFDDGGSLSCMDAMQNLFSTDPAVSQPQSY